MIAPERAIESRVVFPGKLLTIKQEIVENQRGGRYNREIVVHPGAIVLVPVDSQNNVVLVRQYRRAADRTLLELPAGTLGKDEDPAAAAHRELAEETSLAAGRLERIGGFYAAPGYSTEYLHCFLARDLTETEGQPEEDEDIEIVTLPVGDVLARIAAGEIDDAKTIAALAMALPRIGLPLGTVDA